MLRLGFGTDPKWGQVTECSAKEAKIRFLLLTPMGVVSGENTWLWTIMYVNTCR